MARNFRQLFYKLTILAVGTLGGLSGCGRTTPSLLKDNPASRGNRPMVTLIAQLPGPVAPKDQQSATTTRAVNQNLPDDNTAGVSTDVTVTTAAGSCQPMLSIAVELGVTHPRAADLFVTVSTVSRDGRTVYKSVVAFDGPTQARGQTPAAIAKISLPGEIDVSKLRLSPDCGRFRIDIADFAARNTGTVNSVGIKARTAWFPFAHDVNFYTNELFGPGDENVADYYREVSRGQLQFFNAGIYGPVTWNGWSESVTDDQHVADVVHLLEDQGVDFGSFDKNHDGRVDSSELEIVEIENSNDVGGANRGGACVPLQRSSLRVCARTAIFSEETDFATMAHEISHSMGTTDLYGSWNQECMSNGMTLMSCTIAGPDDPAIYYLDPWHRSRILNWYTPYSSGCLAYELGDETWRDRFGNQSRPSIFRNPNNQNEYYLFEYRDRRGYDRDVADWGIAAWHVQENANGSPYKGPNGDQPPGHAIYAVGPDNSKGGSRAWKAGDGVFQVKWEDGTPLSYTFSVAEPRDSANSAILNCSAGTSSRTPDVRILTPQDGGSGPVGHLVLTAAATTFDGSNATITWSSDMDGVLGTGASIGADFLSTGKRVITATAKDAHGSTGTAVVSYMFVGVAPTATISAPTGTATFNRNQPVQLIGSASSPSQFSLPCERLRWTVDVLPSWSMIGCSGTPSFDLVGTAVFQLTATASNNLIGTATVSVVFVEPEPAGPPIVTITAPVANALLMVDTSYQISGVITSPRGDSVTYRWTVLNELTNVESELSTSESFSWTPRAQVPIARTYVQVRLYGADQHGQTTVSSQRYYVDRPPG